MAALPSRPPFGSVFLAARLLEDGSALRTLEARCEEARWRVCPLRPALPMGVNDFVWLPDGPLRGELGMAWLLVFAPAALLPATPGRKPADATVPI